MKKYNLVVFDMDGTLLDSGHAHKEMFDRFWETRSNGRCPIDGTAGPTIWNVFKPSGIERREMRGIFDQLDVFYRNEAGDIIARLKFVEEAQNVLEKLHAAGIRTALVSNSHAALVAEVVENNKARGWFDIVSGATYEEEDKQARLLKTADALDMPRQSVLYVGDNESDGRTAHEIGMDGAVVLSPISWMRDPVALVDLVKPDYIVFELSRILNVAL